jgi:thioredoxin 1
MHTLHRTLGLAIGLTSMAFLGSVTYAGQQDQAKSTARVSTSEVAPGQSQGTSPATTPKAAQKKPEKTLVFFMNPNGRPCQMQDAIIHGMKDTLAGLATVRYYKTTESGDLQAFGKYGIRSLPSLIVLDGNGKELKRFTPGIQDEATILSGLTPRKK